MFAHRSRNCQRFTVSESPAGSAFSNPPDISNNQSAYSQFDFLFPVFANLDGRVPRELAVQTIRISDRTVAVFALSYLPFFGFHALPVCRWIKPGRIVKAPIRSNSCLAFTMQTAKRTFVLSRCHSSTPFSINYFPVLPYPPAPRAVSERSSTSTYSTAGIGTIDSGLLIICVSFHHNIGYDFV